MKVYIPAISLDCPAAKSVNKEPIDYEIVLLEDDFSYSKLLCDLWRQGDGFIILEHDIVPFYGALNLLVACPHDWCSYPYPLARNTIRSSMGCIKISTDIIESNPKLYKQWEGALWGLLDGRFLPKLTTAGYTEHVHWPALAHIK